MTTQTPVTWLQDLDPEVQAWYVKIMAEGGSIQSHLRRDISWRERETRKVESDGKSIRFNEDELKWTQALVDAGLATYSPSEIIEAVWATKIWKYASVARDGSDYDWYAVVKVLDEDLGVRDRDGTVIAFLHGAGLDKSGRSQEGPYAEWQLKVRHSKATDFEHDAAYLANFKLLNPVIEDMSHYGSITVLAVLGTAEMYGRGNDPLENQTEDPEIGSAWCDGWVDRSDGQHTPHPFAPYTVEDKEHKEQLAEFKGRLVRIEMIYRALVDENGKLLQKFNDGEDDE